MNKPAHIIEIRHVPVDGHHFPQPMTFIDGHMADFHEMEALGWRNVATWQEESKDWIERSLFEAGVDAWDKVRAARMSAVSVFGDRQGVISDPPHQFETYLLKEGWHPVLMDHLNAYCPGLVLTRNRLDILFTHFFQKEGTTIYMRLGDDHRFLFSIDKLRWHQVPVGKDKFDDAVNGRLPVMEHWGQANVPIKAPIAQGQ